MDAAPGQWVWCSALVCAISCKCCDIKINVIVSPLTSRFAARFLPLPADKLPQHFMSPLRLRNILALKE